MIIYTNEFNYEGFIFIGEIDKKVEFFIDKVRVFSEILMNRGNVKKNLSVYIGDLVGDLFCLFKADIGIVVGLSLSFRRVGS